jgi:hypothetical protein
MKMRQPLKAALLGALIALSATGCASVEGSTSAGASASALAAAIACPPTRTPANLARDRYRHPAKPLAFFGVDPTDTVVEIWPGGGWYTESSHLIWRSAALIMQSPPVPRRRRSPG